MQEETRNISASSSLSAYSPSFTTYSSENIADIAARVVHELNLSPHDNLYDDHFYDDVTITDNDVTVAHDDVDENDENDDVESEFEFAVLPGGDTSSPISADDIFYNGQIKPLYYPLFNTSLIYGNYNAVSVSGRDNIILSRPEMREKVTTTRLPLRKLMREDDYNESIASTSSSSSSCNSGCPELEGVPPETYCVWAPQKNKKKENDNDTVVTMKKKSHSTGTTTGGGGRVGLSKRWGFKDFMHRSNSDGKDTFVFKNSNAVNSNGKKMGEVKKKTYIGYKEDFIGFLGNVNGISRTIRPF